MEVQPPAPVLRCGRCPGLGGGGRGGWTDGNPRGPGPRPPAGQVLAPDPWPLAMELSTLLSTHRIHPHPSSHRG